MAFGFGQLCVACLGGERNGRCAASVTIDIVTAVLCGHRVAPMTIPTSHERIERAAVRAVLAVCCGGLALFDIGPAESLACVVVDVRHGCRLLVLRCVG